MEETVCNKTVNELHDMINAIFISSKVDNFHCIKHVLLKVQKVLLLIISLTLGRQSSAESSFVLSHLEEPHYLMLVCEPVLTSNTQQVCVKSVQMHLQSAES